MRVPERRALGHRREGQPGDPRILRRLLRSASPEQDDDVRHGQAGVLLDQEGRAARKREAHRLARGARESRRSGRAADRFRKLRRARERDVLGGSQEPPADFRFVEGVGGFGCGHVGEERGPARDEVGTRGSQDGLRRHLLQLSDELVRQVIIPQRFVIGQIRGDARDVALGQVILALDGAARLENLLGEGPLQADARQHPQDRRGRVPHPPRLELGADGQGP
jgi:hypothetical protein